MPTNDLSAAIAFFRRLGFSADFADGSYAILLDDFGGEIHLQISPSRWLVPGRNPFGIYIYRDDVDTVAEFFAGEIIGADGPTAKPWGTYEFALNGPDETLVRVGRPLIESV